MHIHGGGPAVVRDDLEIYSKDPVGCSCSEELHCMRLVRMRQFLKAPSYHGHLALQATLQWSYWAILAVSQSLAPSKQNRHSPVKVQDFAT